MKAFGKFVFAACAVLGMAVCFTGCNYNAMVAADEAVEAQWAQVQNQYQRRYDLIPNLVNTIKGAASHEKDVFIEVTEARSKAGGVINVDSKILEDPEAFARYQKIQDELGSSLQRLMAVAEAYPELKANQNFLALQDELEGTENRISVERKRYNDLVKVYNKKIRSFPSNLFANMYGFEKKPYFQAAAEAQTAPAVEF